MFSKTFALTGRALRVDSRMIRPHLLRFCLLAVLFWYLVVTQWSSIRFGAPGLQLFTSIIYLSFWAVTIAGCSYFATAITEEKEEMTLGLLRMAGVSPVSLLLGKSVPRLLATILLLATQFPFTLLAITLGGVTRHQVVSAYLCLFAHTLFLMGLALFFSVLSRTSRRASWLMSLLVIAAFVGPYVAKVALSGLIASGAVTMADPLVAAADWCLDVIWDASAFWRIGTIMLTGFSEPAVSFQVITNVVAAVVLFGLAWLCFVFFVQEEPAASPERGFAFRRTAKARLFAVGRAWKHALVWKDFHFLAGGKGLMIVKLVVYGGIFPLFDLYQRAIYGYGYTRQDYGALLIGAMLLAGGIEIALYASRIFREEIRWRTLSSLLMIPGSVPRLVYSKIAGCAIALFPSVLYLGIGICLNWTDVRSFLRDDLDEPAVWWFGMQYLVFVHLVALFSLIVKWGALPLALAVVFFCNFCCISTFTMAAPAASGEDMAMVIITLVCVIFIVSIQIVIAERLRALGGE